MPADFAKLYHIDHYGQVLIQKDESDYKSDDDELVIDTSDLHEYAPTITVKWYIEGIGIAEQTVIYPPTDKGLADRDEIFVNMTPAQAEKIMSSTGNIFSNILEPDVLLEPDAIEEPSEC